MEDTAKTLKKLLREAEQKKWVDTLMFQIKVIGLPTPEREYKFHPHRDFKADICWPGIKFIVEVDGGQWLEKGGHTTGTGFERDRRRDCEAFVLGFKVVRVTPDMIEEGYAIKVIEILFKGTLI